MLKVTRDIVAKAGGTRRRVGLSTSCHNQAVRSPGLIFGFDDELSIDFLHRGYLYLAADLTAELGNLICQSLNNRLGTI